VPLLLVLLALAAGAAALIVEVVQASGEDATAQVGADAAALAGALDGPTAAHELAAANGGELVAYEAAGGRFEVEVAHRRASARAAAERMGSTGPAERQALAPALQAALARADQLLGWQVPIAPPAPEHPLHDVGLAVDVPPDAVSELLAIAAQAGLCQQSPGGDPVHFEPCPPSRP
jgi:hypothetical protein